MQPIPVEAIYLIGSSFVLGSFVTILLLIILDVMRTIREKK